MFAKLYTQQLAELMARQNASRRAQHHKMQLQLHFIEQLQRSVSHGSKLASPLPVLAAPTEKASDSALNSPSQGSTNNSINSVS